MDFNDVKLTICEEHYHLIVNFRFLDLHIEIPELNTIQLDYRNFKR